MAVCSLSKKLPVSQRIGQQWIFAFAGMTNQLFSQVIPAHNGIQRSLLVAETTIKAEVLRANGQSQVAGRLKNLADFSLGG